MKAVEAEYLKLLSGSSKLVATIRTSPTFTPLRESDTALILSNRFLPMVEMFLNNVAKRKIVFGAMRYGVPTDIYKHFALNIRNESMKTFVLANSVKFEVMGLSGEQLNPDCLHLQEAGSNNITKKAIPAALLPDLAAKCERFTFDDAKLQGVSGSLYL